MAQGKKRASARRGKTVRRSKAPQRAKGAKKTAKRSATKAKPKKAAIKAKSKRAVSKRPAPKIKPPQQRAELPIEVIKIETVDKPAPGTVIVTEYEEVRVPSVGSKTGQTGKQGSFDLPDPEED
jgi:hypothetical protein